MHYAGGRRRKTSFCTGAGHAHVDMLSWMTREITFARDQFLFRAISFPAGCSAAETTESCFEALHQHGHLSVFFCFLWYPWLSWKCAELKQGAPWWWRNYHDMHDCQGRDVSTWSPVLTHTENKSSAAWISNQALSRNELRSDVRCFTNTVVERICVLLGHCISMYSEVIMRSTCACVLGDF